MVVFTISLDKDIEEIKNRLGRIIDWLKLSENESEIIVLKLMRLASFLVSATIDILESISKKKVIKEITNRERGI